jgi:hypothetical protein
MSVMRHPMAGRSGVTGMRYRRYFMTAGFDVVMAEVRHVHVRYMYVTTGNAIEMNMLSSVPQVHSAGCLEK